jgi:hypothetical protein
MSSGIRLPLSLDACRMRSAMVTALAPARLATASVTAGTRFDQPLASLRDELTRVSAASSAAKMTSATSRT